VDKVVTNGDAIFALLGFLSRKDGRDVMFV